VGRVLTVCMCSITPRNIPAGLRNYPCALTNPNAVIPFVRHRSGQVVDKVLQLCQGQAQLMAAVHDQQCDCHCNSDTQSSTCLDSSSSVAHRTTHTHNHHTQCNSTHSGLCSTAAPAVLPAKGRAEASLRGTCTHTHTHMWAPEHNTEQLLVQQPRQTPGHNKCPERPSLRLPGTNTSGDHKQSAPYIRYWVAPRDQGTLIP
jgi:hypothetical protein